MRVDGVPRQDASKVVALVARLRELATSAQPERPTPRPAPIDQYRADQSDQQKTVSETELRQFAETLEGATQRLNSGIRLDIDEGTGRVIAQIIDRDTREVVRQIPSQELLDIAAHLNDLVGLLFDAEG